MTTTPNVTVLPSRNAASQLVAQEIRAELARQGRSARSLARQINRTHTWVSVRLSPSAKVDLTVDEIAEMAEALNVPVQRLLLAWLPRLDSNQQPSGYTSRLVSGLRGWVRRRVRAHQLGQLAIVVDLSEARANRLERAS